MKANRFYLCAKLYECLMKFAIGFTLLLFGWLNSYATEFYVSMA